MPAYGVLIGNEFWFGTMGQKSRNLRCQPYAIVHNESADDVAIIEGTVERLSIADTPESRRAGLPREIRRPTNGQPSTCWAFQSLDIKGWLYVLRIKVGHAVAGRGIPGNSDPLGDLIVTVEGW